MLFRSKVYVGDEDGDFVVLAAKGGAKAQVLSETNLGAPVYSTPIVANGTMYVASQTHLFAIGAADAKATDANNPDAKLKARPIMGLPMLQGFKPAGPGKWTGGKIYDPNSGKTYDSKLTVTGAGTLKVEGCILMVCQAQTWRRS
mgnify:CR=1 FL=1